MHAANVTVTHTHAGLEEALADLGAWRRRIAAEGTGWKLVLRAGAIPAARDEGRTGIILGWQNTLPLGGNPARAWAFAAAGLRVAQLTHNETNLSGDGCAETRNGGLSDFGREVVAELNGTGIAGPGKRWVISTGRCNTCCKA